jgi:hypothetical protein
MRRTLVVLSMAAAALVAGCGGGGRDHAIATAAPLETATASSSAGSSRPQTDFELYLAAMRSYAKCLRAGGLDAADPDANGNVAVLAPDGSNPKTGRYLPVLVRCSKYVVPNPRPVVLTPAELRGQHAYAACMRRNGVPGYPDDRAVQDPASQEREQQLITQAQAANPPAFTRAQRLCDAAGVPPGARRGTPQG